MRDRFSYRIDRPTHDHLDAELPELGARPIRIATLSRSRSPPPACRRSVCTQPRRPCPTATTIGVQALCQSRGARVRPDARDTHRRRAGLVPQRAEGKPWQPQNYDRRYRGPITLEEALEQSVNVVAVKVQERVGVRETIDIAHRLGISSRLQPNLSLALGTSDVSLLQLTSAYGVLANQGRAVASTVIRNVTDDQGRLLEEFVSQEVEVLTPQIAYVMTQMMRGVIDRGTGRVANALGRPRRR